MSIDTVTIPLRVENLGVAFHKHTRVRFIYHSTVTRSTILVSGLLEDITRGAPGQPTLLQVDRLTYHVPPGTVVTVEAKELR
jgi:hypothetical protein